MKFGCFSGQTPPAIPLLARDLVVTQTLVAMPPLQQGYTAEIY